MDTSTDAKVDSPSSHQGVRQLALSDVDLNLLVVFQQLLRHRRVSAAASAMQLSQPAVSCALNRLRRVLGDRLFVRTNRGMLPTPYAEALALPLSEALVAIQATLNQRSTFDPGTSSRHFTLALADVGELYFLPPLIGAIAGAAPGIGLTVVSSAKESLRDDMEEGKVDLAIGVLPELKTDIFQRRLFEQRYVCLFRKGHLLDRPEFDGEVFAHAEHIVVDSGRGHLMVNGMVERLFGRRSVKLRLPHFVALPRILQATDLVATVPEKIAACLAAPFDLRYVAPRPELPSFQINLFWHAKFQHDPGSRWLRNLIFDNFGE